MAFISCIVNNLTKLYRYINPNLGFLRLDHIRWFLWRKWIYKPLNILVSFIFYTSNSLMSLMISLNRIPVPTVTANSKKPDVHVHFLSYLSYQYVYWKLPYELRDTSSYVRKCVVGQILVWAIIRSIKVIIPVAR